MSLVAVNKLPARCAITAAAFPSLPAEFSLQTDMPHPKRSLAADIVGNIRTIRVPCSGIASGGNPRQSVLSRMD